MAFKLVIVAGEGVKAGTIELFIPNSQTQIALIYSTPAVIS